MNSPIKILVTIPDLKGSGTEKMVSCFLKYFDRQKISADVLLAERRIDYEIPKDVVVYDLNINNSTDFSFAYKIYRFFAKIVKIGRFLRSHEYDIIVSFLDGHNVQTSISCQLFNIKKPLILCEHVLEENFFKMNPFAKKMEKISKFLVKISYKRANRILCLSQAIKDYLEKDLKIKNKISVIYNGIEIEKIDAYSGLPEEKSFLESPVRILNVGCLNDNKNQSLLIDAFKILLLKKPEASLFILGKGENHDYLEEKIKKDGLEKKVFLLGWKDNVFSYLKNSDVLVSVSKHESFGNIFIEAMSCGLPVLSTFSTRALLEIFQNGKYGKIIENYEPQTIADSILEVLETESKNQEFKNKIMNYSRDKFNVKNLVMQYENAIIEEYGNNKK